MQTILDPDRLTAVLPFTLQQRTFRIGIVHLRLRTGLRRLLSDYTDLYQEFMTADQGTPDIDVFVDRTPLSMKHHRRFEIMVNGCDRFRPTHVDGVLPHIDWAINWELPRIFPQYLQLHAATLEKNGAGFIFSGHSGVGKSTLTTGLIKRGWRYFCDEFALIEVDSLELQPFPRAICIKQPAYPVLESLGLEIHGKKHFSKGAKGYVGFVKPLSIKPNAIAQPCPIRYVIFPHYFNGAKSALTPMHRAEAAFALHPNCYNLLQCNVPAIDVLTRVVRNAECYRLTTGNIHETVELLTEFVEAKSMPRAQSA